MTSCAIEAASSHHTHAIHVREACFEFIQPRALSFGALAIFDVGTLAVPLDDFSRSVA